MIFELNLKRTWHPFFANFYTALVFLEAFRPFLRRFDIWFLRRSWLFVVDNIFGRLFVFPPWLIREVNCVFLGAWLQRPLFGVFFFGFVSLVFLIFKVLDFDEVFKIEILVLQIHPLFLQTPREKFDLSLDGLRLSVDFGEHDLNCVRLKLTQLL